MEPTLSQYLLVSGALFAIGLLGVIVRRNLLIIYMSLELMLNASNVALVAVLEPVLPGRGGRGGRVPKLRFRSELYQKSRKKVIFG